MSWKVKDKEQAHSCSEIAVPKVYLSFSVKMKIEALMDAYPHQEWLGYLTGEDKPTYIEVEDMIIPPHAQASGGSADAEPLHMPANCVGFIHSHNSMGAFHSGTDDAHVDRNYRLSITVAKNHRGLDFDALTCQTTPCKKLLLARTTISFRYPTIPVADEWLVSAKANIDKGVHVYQRPASYADSTFTGERMFVPATAEDKEGNLQVGFNVNGHFVSEKDYYAHMREIFQDKGELKESKEFNYKHSKDYKVGEASERWEEDKKAANPILTGEAGEDNKWGNKDSKKKK